MIGSPIVFQTAPPQPSSNALATWTYVLVGGPEASQNGFGDLMPAKLTERSAMASSGRKRGLNHASQPATPPLPQRSGFWTVCLDGGRSSNASRRNQQVG